MGRSCPGSDNGSKKRTSGGDAGALAGCAAAIERITKGKNKKINFMLINASKVLENL
jgi:hypothetical protein